MLYCNESETDMIKWKSKYKQKTFEVSASDEFSKKAEIMTKKASVEQSISKNPTQQRYTLLGKDNLS